MTIKDAATLLGLAPRTLRQQARNGVLDATREGRDWWVSEQAVERYRREHLGRRGRPAKEKQS